MLLLMSLLASFSLFGQNNTPGLVLEAFSEREPEVLNPHWEYREGAFVAMYPHIDGLKKVFFNEEGEWLETRTRLAQESLPVGVKQFINERYAEADITYVGKVDQLERTLYRVESELNTSVVIKLLNEQGVLVDENKIDWGYILN